MTKLYVVVADYGYDGCGDPEGVYTTRELADSAIAKRYSNGHYSRRDIVELTLDAEIAE